MSLEVALTDPKLRPLQDAFSGQCSNSHGIQDPLFYGNYSDGEVRYTQS